MSTTTPTARGSRAALPVLLAGAFMVVLDFFIVNVALPSIALDLGAGDSALEWVVAGYGLTFAAFLVAGGRLGDRIGRRRAYGLGLGLFTVASAACGLAPSAGALVAARLAQGVAGAILMPQVLAIVGVAYRDEERVRALSAYGIALGLAAVGGQVLGGALLSADLAGLDWRLCFLINVPVGLAALALAPRLLPESRSAQPVRADLAGTLTLAAALVAVLLPLIEGRQTGWPLWTWASLAAAPALAAAFVAHQSRLGRAGGSPLLDIALFRDRSFAAGLVTQLALASAQAAFFVYLAIYLQEGRGLSPLAAGAVFSILAAAYVAVSGSATRLAARAGRAVVGAGGALLASGFALVGLAVDLGGATLALVPGLLLCGAGIGLSFTPLTAIVLARVEPERAGAATGAMSTTQQVGNSIGVAVTGVVFFGYGGDVAGAFALSLAGLAAAALLVVAASRLLPLAQPSS
jgi:EmrB/QacA subfamily drug resistance transporter